jgi:transcriptional regulator with XRE-family HTH domain
VDDLRPAFGARLRSLRKERQLSQEDLAERADLHWTYVSDLERGQQTPTLDVVNRIARGLRVTLAEFFRPFDGSFRPRQRQQRQERRPPGRRTKGATSGRSP